MEAPGDSGALEWRLYVAGAAEPSQEQLLAARAACLAIAAPLLAGHIWQREPFSLELRAASGGEPSCLGGCAEVGECVEEEWTVAWLLLHLTSRLPQLTARVWDGDGDFLLIEAAYALPRWARKPETTVNRVFLRGGRLRLLRPERGAVGWSLRDGLAACQVEASTAEAAESEAVQARLQERLGGFPDRLAEQQHTSRCRVPARVALLLREEPQLAAAAITAFYERDPAAVRDAARSVFFPPSLQPVTVPLRLSRLLYAQLQQQHFEPPRGASPLPAEGHPDRNLASLGVKLTAGFEMLAAGWARRGEPGGVPLPDAALSAHPAPSADGEEAGQSDWSVYCEQLRSGGFWGVLPADAPVCSDPARLAQAQAAHAATRAHLRSVDAARSPSLRSAEIFAAAAAAAAAAGSSDFPLASQFFPEPGPETEQSEAWMGEGEALLESSISQRERERESFERSRGKGGGAAPSATPSSGGDGAEEGATEAERAAAAAMGGVVGGLRSFLAAQGGVEGAHVPGEEAGVGGVRPDRFLRELSDALGLDWESDGGGESQSDDLSDDFDEETASEDEQGEPEGRAAGADWRRFTAREGGGDSDDEADGSEGGDGEGFEAEYGAALEGELRGTAMGEDFERGEGGGGAEDLAPVDVDLNLVRSLLQSYGAQEGLPGPASNLLGVLGLSLPHNSDGR